jgi:hypothetical protein
MAMREMLMDILLENVKASNHFEDPVIYGRLMFDTLYPQELKWEVWLDLIRTGYRPLAGVCQYGEWLTSLTVS